MKIHLFSRASRKAWLLTALLSAGVFTSVLHAQTSVATGPVGCMTLSCLGGSDSIVSIPFNRPAVFVGSATHTSGTAAGHPGGVPKRGTRLVFSGTPFKASQYKYTGGTQPNTYFALLVSGPKAGGCYTITDNDTNSLTIDLAGDNLRQMAGAATVQIVPFWTLNTAFPGGAGVTASNGSTMATQIIVPDPSSATADAASSFSYYYSAAAAAWLDSYTDEPANDTLLPPNHYFTVRNNGDAATALTLSGALVSGPLTIPLLTDTDVPFDNAIALIRPTPVSLNDSGLVSSGAFLASDDSTAGDQLLVFDNTVAGLDKTAALIYTYSSGSWQRSDGVGNAGTDLVFVPGTGVLIHKAATDSGLIAFWINPSL